jgi:hypothetical protein
VNSKLFVHPLFDYGLIGGGFSLVFFAIYIGLLSGDGLSGGFSATTIATCTLLSTSAHFAASTVRLYTKKDAHERHAFLSSVVPILLLLLLPIGLLFADLIGAHIQALYLTWSPYHYAAQSYGLTVMYCYRSGLAISPLEKRWLRRVCMLPFLFIVLYGKGCGLDWLLSEAFRAGLPAPVLAGLRAGYAIFPALSFVAPVVAFFWVARRHNRFPPLIAPLLVLTNAVWWFLLPPLDAFVWATVFHGLQYMAITVLFHVRDRLAAPGNSDGWVRHASRFYGACLALGYGLFVCLPHAYTSLGFGAVESLLIVTAVVNIHHFVVDAYIWRLRPGDTNRGVVDAA